MLQEPEPAPLLPVIRVEPLLLTDDGQDEDAGTSDEDAGEIRDIGQSKLADLARRSLRIRRRVALHRQRRRHQLQLHEQQMRCEQEARSRQAQRLRRDKDILTNFMRLRLYETQSSFSSSEVASSSGMERSSDSERRAEDPSGEDRPSPRNTASVSGLSASTRAEAAEGGLGLECTARSRRRDDLRKILRLRRRRRRLMLLRCGEGGVEQYTDKTRNAAVVMGEKDIKLSLKQQRRALAAARGFSLPACAQPSGLTALARAHRRTGQPRAALQLLEQALLLDPCSKAALLERSQCYQQLGQPRLALLDAEDALDLDKTNDAALLHKAQALYSMGHFEKSLVMFHRGSRLRPENPAFKVGIIRATEAIMNIIGCLSKDFTLSSCERLLRTDTWPDEDSSIGSARQAASRGASRGASLLTTATSDALSNAFTDYWTGEDSYDKAVGEHTEWQAPAGTYSSQLQVHGGAGLCESCNTAHQHGAVPFRPPPPGYGPGSRRGSRAGSRAASPDEARQIALILSVTNAHDCRNKHLREKLMFIPPSPPASRAASSASSMSRRGPRSPHGPHRPLHCSRPWERGQPCPAPHAAPHPAAPEGGRPAASCRPGVDRVPPSLGRDAIFLQQIALDPMLQGLPVSGLAEEAVRYLKSRQIFWQRRGPIKPGGQGQGHNPLPTARPSVPAACLA